MSPKNSHARDSFQLSLDRVDSMLSKAPVGFAATEVGLKKLGKRLVASQYGNFADQLTKLTDSVERKPTVSIKCELVVPEVAFDAFGTLLLKADGAITISGEGRKDKNLLDTYRFPVVFNVEALKDAAAFVSEMRVEIDKLYSAGETLLVR